jgi:SAM-dependent methyltransferase
MHLITAFDCIEHLERDQEALHGFHRALRPGGFLFVSVPAYQFLYAENDRIARHQRRYTRGALVAKVQEAGFEVIQASYVNALLFPLILPAVLALKLRQRLFPRPDPETNLSYVPRRWINSLLAGIFGSERHFLRYVSFPAGHSLIVAARKRG